MKKRPKCPVCGKGIGRRATEMREQLVPHGEPANWPATNKTVCRSWSHNAGAMSLNTHISDENGKTEFTHTKHLQELWDGESFYLPPTRPFCGNPCALKFAREAYSRGFRT